MTRGEKWQKASLNCRRLCAAGLAKVPGRAHRFRRFRHWYRKACEARKLTTMHKDRIKSLSFHWS